MTRDYTPRIHYRHPRYAGTDHDHWTVCGLFRGAYNHTRVAEEVTCGHCRAWLGKAADT
jgi:hypothetical protein